MLHRVRELGACAASSSENYFEGMRKLLVTKFRPGKYVIAGLCVETSEMRL
jgi:hypothetical protein